ncbi:sensor histidine kinase [Hoyosella altamirensis]|uniref:histidine kinase n=1 Tax=Hoyosella altamirensis TaxID=616997 RepID=A0A839RN84_9ACTN|nr:sensor histidine kinase [Hoyosella altamirensis]MBB3038215.1 sensor histidine kinase regulating citrate/malate metabolism [Hoyosella altamirensis]
MRPRLTLAGQFLALQLTIIMIVLIVVTGVALAQFDAAFRQSEGRRMSAIAETGASTETIRIGIADPAQRGLLPPAGESLRTLSGADFVIIADPDLRIYASPDPSDLERRFEVGPSPVLDGRAWSGSMEHNNVAYIAAHVPVIADGAVIGIVAAGRAVPTIGQRLITAAPGILSYLAIAGLIGFAGSLLLSRRVKRQTLGLEPDAITRLVRHREAMLHGIREGVLGLDGAGRITVVSESARELLGLPPDATGRTISDLGLDPELQTALISDEPQGEQVIAVRDRVITLNRMPLTEAGAPAGSVTTMRDRTDLLALQSELAVSKTTTDALRAQAHEFSNQLHVISGLLELGEHDEVQNYVRKVGGTRAQLTDSVKFLIQDPAVAALLIAKTSLAAEQGSTLTVSDESALSPLPDRLVADVVTVVGNLIDNALDALSQHSGPGQVEVTLAEHAGAVSVRVRDTGPGIPEDQHAKIFERGYSTKDSQSRARGYGLALTQVICARRGGSVTVRSGAEGTSSAPWGAEFTARLPRTPADDSGSRKENR